MTIRPNIPDAEYHGSTGVTFHRLKEFISSGPAWYQGRYVTGMIPPKADKDWATLGRAYHIYGLEGPEAFAKQVIAMPATYRTADPKLVPWNNRLKVCKEWTAANPGKEPPKEILDGPPAEEKEWNLNANACREWVEQQAGKVVLSRSDYDAAFCIGRNMRANQHASRLLAMGWPELTIEQSEPRFPVPIKCRIDWLASISNQPGDAWAIVDPKGTDDIDHFERDVWKYGYDRQMAFYRWMTYLEIGKQLPVFLVALEKGGMHRARVHQLPDSILDPAHDRNCRDLDRLAACYASGVWPLDHDDSIRVVQPPSWMRDPANAVSNGPAPWEE